MNTQWTVQLDIQSFLFFSLLQFFPDVAWERGILSLRVFCKRSERGCDWSGPLRHYEVPCALAACNMISLVLHQLKFCLLCRCNADGFSSNAGLLVMCRRRRFEGNKQKLH